MVTFISGQNILFLLCMMQQLVDFSLISSVIEISLCGFQPIYLVHPQSSNALAIRLSARMVSSLVLNLLEMSENLLQGIMIIQLLVVSEACLQTIFCSQIVLFVIPTATRILVVVKAGRELIPISFHNFLIGWHWPFQVFSSHTALE